MVCCSKRGRWRDEIDYLMGSNRVTDCLTPALHWACQIVVCATGLPVSVFLGFRQMQMIRSIISTKNMAVSPSQRLNTPPMLDSKTAAVIAGLSSTTRGKLRFSTTFSCRKFSLISAIGDVFYNATHTHTHTHTHTQVRVQN